MSGDGAPLNFVKQRQNTEWKDAVDVQRGGELLSRKSQLFACCTGAIAASEMLIRDCYSRPVGAKTKRGKDGSRLRKWSQPHHNCDSAVGASAIEGPLSGRIRGSRRFLEADQQSMGHNRCSQSLKFSPLSCRNGRHGLEHTSDVSEPEALDLGPDLVVKQVACGFDHTLLLVEVPMRS